MLYPTYAQAQDPGDSSQSAPQGGEVRSCFQSACGFLGKAILTASRLRGLRWAAAEQWGVETRDLQNKQATEAHCSREGQAGGQDRQSVLKTISTSHQQVHLFGCNKLNSLAIHTDFLHCQKYMRWAKSGGNGRRRQGERVCESGEMERKCWGLGGAQRQLLLSMDIITTVASGSEMPCKEVTDPHSQHPWGPWNSPPPPFSSDSGTPRGLPIF